MSEQSSFKGADNLHKLAMLVRYVYVPQERKNPNIQTLLQNYTKNIVDSIDQLTGSQAIKIPDHIEPDQERALNSPAEMKLYADYLVTRTYPRAAGKTQLERRRMKWAPKTPTRNRPMRSSSTGGPEPRSLAPFTRTSTSRSCRPSRT
jgi:hypothetical protein